MCAPASKKSFYPPCFLSGWISRLSRPFVKTVCQVAATAAWRRNGELTAEKNIAKVRVSKQTVLKHRQKQQFIFLVVKKTVGTYQRKNVRKTLLPPSTKNCDCSCFNPQVGKQGDITKRMWGELFLKAGNRFRCRRKPKPHPSVPPPFSLQQISHPQKPRRRRRGKGEMPADTLTFVSPSPPPFYLQRLVLN